MRELLTVLLLAARRRLVVVTVRGWSMAPSLSDGQRVLVRRARVESVRRGDIVVVAYPQDAGRDSWMIKRCAAVAGDPVPSAVTAARSGLPRRVPDRSIVLLSDEPSHDMDSRRFGLIAGDSVLGVVLGAGCQYT
jgi:signal peptidase I